MYSSTQQHAQHERTTNEVDVSDLNLCIDDLTAPLPEAFAQSIQASGYESTSRIPSISDDACGWTEDALGLQVTLAIPGLRGQPSASLAVLCASNTCTITAFGYVVWSCVLRGMVKPESLQYTINDGIDMIPIIEVHVEKASPHERWGGFILQVGENSLI
jgi:hypothetical protein